MEKKQENKITFRWPLFSTICWFLLFLHLKPDYNYMSFFVGFLSAFGMGLNLSLLSFFINKNKFFSISFYLITLVIFVFNVEHILINQSNLPLAFSKFALDPQFLKSSILNKRILVITLFTITIFLVSYLIEQKLKKIRFHFLLRIKTQLYILLTFIVIQFFLPINLFYHSWFQQNFISYNLLSKTIKNNSDLSKWEKQLQREIDAPLLSNINFPKNNINVVLVILESFSYQHLEAGLAPHLTKFYQKSLSFKNYYTNQVQTNRGLYSLLCSDYPNLKQIEAKADIISQLSQKPECLPKILSKKNYQRIFMQSAPLAFMRKDLFAKSAGFELAAGAESFPPNLIISDWGIGDDTLMNGAMETFLEQKKKGPIFLTMLTVGTHHPYITPVSRNNFEAAISYTDKVFGGLYEFFIKNKLFEDTLLIVTTDEVRLQKDSNNPLKHHHGILAMMGPGLPVMQSLDTYSQVDLGASVSDYLSINSNLPGRSIFRKYKTPNKILIGNAYTKKIIYLENNEVYHLCDYGFNCLKLSGNKLLNDISRLKVSKSELGPFIENKVNMSDLALDKINNKILFEEKNINIKNNGFYVLMSEFKTPSSIANFEIEIDLAFEDKVKNDVSDVSFKYYQYPCGSSHLEHEKIIKLSKVNHHAKFRKNLVVPQNKIEGDLGICHIALLEKSPSTQVTVKKFKLMREKL